MSQTYSRKNDPNHLNSTKENVKFLEVTGPFPQHYGIIHQTEYDFLKKWYNNVTFTIGKFAPAKSFR